MSGLPSFPLVSVLAAPALDPGAMRRDLVVPEGLTIAEIVAAALPDLPPDSVARPRVVLVTERASWPVDPSLWRSVRPKAQARVVIRLVPGDNLARTLLSLVVTIGAVALGQFWAPSLAAWGSGFGLNLSTQVWGALAGAAIGIAGQLLINALIPPPEDPKRRQGYAITRWQNRLEPNGAVPEITGRLRYAPPFAATPYTEISGGWQYVRALFCFGPGPVSLSDFQLGETSLDEFDEVEIEIREGLPGDAPVTLYPRQVVEETVGVELLRPLIRDDRGEVIDDDADGELKPVIRTTAADTASIRVILAWPAGLFRVDDDGDIRSTSVRVKIEQREAGEWEGEEEGWALVRELKVTRRKREAFYRQHRWTPPSRGRWEVRLTMLTNETEDPQKSIRTTWAAIQSIRPEYPLAVDVPLALVALRIKATHQLNGALDNFSAIAQRRCLDWDHETETWITRETRNPASIYRMALQGPANPKPVADAGINLAGLADWHDFCRLKGLRFDRAFDEAGTTLRDTLGIIAAAGRASPRHDGTQWGVTIDRPQEAAIDHISPRNSWGFRATRQYLDPPEGFRVSFLDETNDYKPAERIVPWPGFEGTPVLTEALDLPGKTDPDEVWIEARRRMHEIIHRPDVYEVTQDGPARVATRGDLVRLSHDVLAEAQKAARVRAVAGNVVYLDDTVTMEEGGSYAIRFRWFAGPEDATGSSVVRSVALEPGETSRLMLTGAGDQVPPAGALIHFGPASSETFPLIVLGVEPGDDLTSRLRLIDAAPIIDDLTDAEEPPAWSGRAGEEVGPSGDAPAVPRFVGITTGLAAGTGDAGAVVYEVEPGEGGVEAASFEIAHRLDGEIDWTEVTIPAGEGGGEIEGYTAGDMVDLRARAISETGVEGDWSSTVTVTIGEDDAAIPAALDASTVVVTPVYGGALLELVTPADPNLARLQLYLSTSATLDPEADAYGAPVPVEPARSYALPLGDMTRTNLLTNGSFASGLTGWTADADWSAGSGVAVKVAGTATRHLYQAISVPDGSVVRYSFTIVSITGGNFRPRLYGATMVEDPGQSIAGTYRGDLTAPASTATFRITGTNTAAGEIDDVVAYVQTPACLPQGTNHLWVAPLNADGVEGPIAGPFSFTVI